MKSATKRRNDPLPFEKWTFHNEQPVRDDVEYV